MRKGLILIGLLFLGMTASAYALVLPIDAPHNSSTNIICGDCHSLFTIGFFDDSVCLSCHINDTGGGYSKNSAPSVLTHSSDTTSTKYGIWTNNCIACHWISSALHGQQQTLNFGSLTYLVTGTITSITDNGDGTTTFGYSGLTVNMPGWGDFTKWGQKSGNERGLIMYPNITNNRVNFEVETADATTITVTGGINTAFPGTVAVSDTFALIYGQFIKIGVASPTDGIQRTVRFYQNTGLNSFANDESGTGTDPTPDGICQVCHSQTAHWRNDGTLAAQGIHSGANGANCMVCHPHAAGFSPAGACNTCHGFPPINNTLGGPDGLADNDGGTGSTSPGAHERHATPTGLNFPCETCHTGGMPVTPIFDKIIEIGFDALGVYKTGKYDGRTSLANSFSYGSGDPGTTITQNGTQSCTNVYCHSVVQPDGGGALTLDTSDYKNPVWTGSVQCGECHLGDSIQGNLSLMNSGSHNEINHGFVTDPHGNEGSYSQTPNTPGGGYGSCSDVYCHSIVQTDGGGPLTAGTSDYKSFTWGNINSAFCGSCHAINISTGSHYPHLSIPSFDCATCHTGAGAGTNLHASRNIDINIDPSFGASAVYSQDPNPPGGGYGSCLTTLCHGGSSPQWGTDFTGIDQCTKCHGTPTASPAPDYAKAPPIDTNGDNSNTDPQVGAHQEHLRSLNGFTAGIACNECHVVPANVDDPGHFDTLSPAELNFGALASSNGATPSYDSLSGQCSGTYCHGNAMPRGTTEGNNMTPTWNDPGYLNGDSNHDCAQCHGYPPLAIPAHAGRGPGDCIICHDHVNAAGTGFTDPSLHVNGVLDGGGDNCSDCHSNANLSARHTVHTDPDTFLAGKTLSGGDWGNPATGWYDYSNTGGTPFMGCGYCHPNNEAVFHINGAKNLNFDPNEPGLTPGTLKGKNGDPQVFTQNTGVSVTCSSVYCHSTGYNDGTGYGYQTSPDWHGGSFAGDKCSNCHGNSPNTDGKLGSLSHYNPDAMGMGVPGGHFVGIHYDNVFTGANGLIQDANGNNNSHGDALTSQTINCQICHNTTVTSSANDQNTVCSTCHGVGSIPLMGDMVLEATSTTHVNGQPDIVFETIIMKSKAQIRDDITTVVELNNNWTRIDAYKQPGSHDESTDTLTNAAVYNAGSKTCVSVACHNGNLVQWGSTEVDCNSCHTALP
ncbi:MAG: CxxxxCH/CxxCH domain c-type cytochrome [Planctomycetota bacterium]|jgi:predicted CxxxxCH...CXXCH cytochrome family protein